MGLLRQEAHKLSDGRTLSAWVVGCVVFAAVLQGQGPYLAHSRLSASTWGHQEMLELLKALVVSGL